MHLATATVLATLTLLASVVQAHPEPDIPVRSRFAKDGSAAITLEIDPRCFAADPITEPYTTKAQLDLMTGAAKKALLDKTAALIQRSIEFHFDPGGKVASAFALEFAGIGEALLNQPDDPVMVVGRWKLQTPAGSTGYKLAASKDGKFAVIFRNYLEGIEHPRFSVLFPGETSFIFDLKAAK